MNLNNRLREIRMQEYLEEPADFAKRLGISLKNYYKYEDGTTKPRLDVAVDISQKLNRTVNDIWYLD